MVPVLFVASVPSFFSWPSNQVRLGKEMKEPIQGDPGVNYQH